MDHIFQVHRLNDAGLARADKIANAFDSLLSIVSAECGAAVSTHEFHQLRNRLGEACFYAKKAMANNPANQLNSGEKL